MWVQRRLQGGKGSAGELVADSAQMERLSDSHMLLTLQDSRRHTLPMVGHG
jgi:hypothetical protein